MGHCHFCPHEMHPSRTTQLGLLCFAKFIRQKSFEIAFGLNFFCLNSQTGKLYSAQKLMNFHRSCHHLLYPPEICSPQRFSIPLNAWAPHSSYQVCSHPFARHLCASCLLSGCTKMGPHCLPLEVLFLSTLTATRWTFNSQILLKILGKLFPVCGSELQSAGGVHSSGSVRGG